MSYIVPEVIESYALAHSQPFPSYMEELAEETQVRTDAPGMMSGGLGGGLLRMLALLVGARRILEIGMFTGFGTLAMAEALPPGGEIHTLELDADYLEIAGKYFDRSPAGDRIHVHIGPAAESLARLSGPFDMAFLDADKENYLHYYEEVLRLLRPGGLLVVDNALWSGRVLEPRDPAAVAIARLNQRIAGDERVDRVLVTVRDGMFLVRKR